MNQTFEYDLTLLGSGFGEHVLLLTKHKKPYEQTTEMENMLAIY